MVQAWQRYALEIVSAKTIVEETLRKTLDFPNNHELTSR
ncbi:hypothetical protein F442_08984 [Phytophthora nicotianae P10297]|uniref:Uncharacterized protein n=4 Tax=Phytophthora nicotianae TaxID=4792 RepID=W2Q6G5_PHYN3|nr:hypothetical protein PPTG_22966 [Phytophthora nicotianae INRA-310]ETI46563.1 hypothetical protein F443_09054 [Phytophthora nicotianae P1569]ETL39915.1 hypothetical protein L916_08790 [Phytophthora nicotianae]ETP44417.1 hypothetical protein F442_08984 [Phytophthora nicotianae P10297]ETL93044.1 hypothetical protein L917_08712 [Phytophthora nicotianae]ETM46341.1 hypothetical protein L914_08742 [Phytophthora nicotianae]